MDLNIDLLALIGADTALKKTASSNGGEYHGPCPFCGGNDRFWVQPNASKPRWHCRGCGKGGDAVQYLVEGGMSYKEAFAALGAEDRTQLIPRGMKQPEPAPAVVPPAWGELGRKCVAECEALLWSEKGARARAWLAARGLIEGTLREFHLGYEPQDMRRHTLWIYGGIVIPLIGVDGILWGINVRRPVVADYEEKYKAVQGSNKRAMLGRLTGRHDLLITEGETDMMLAWQLVGDLVDVATFGACSVQPSGRWMPYLAGYRRILLAYDLDDAGEKGAERWAWCQRAVRVRLPMKESEGKDITDFVKRGGDLRSWISVCLAGGRSASHQPSAVSNQAAPPSTQDSALSTTSDPDGVEVIEL